MLIEMYQEKVGSNPGGKAKVTIFGRELDVYLKYVYGSKLLRQIPFVPHNQPIYEALTLLLARQFGLKVPDFFVLDNHEKHIQFSYGPNIRKSNRNLDSNHPYYFISIIFQETPDIGILEQLVQKEKMYRDFLMIGDIEGRKQNYGLYQVPGNGQTVVYIDLGCSFVDAHEGFIKQRTGITKLIRDQKGFIHEHSKNEFRGVRKYLENLYIISNHHNPSQQQIISLIELIDSIPEQKIPLISTSPKIKLQENRLGYLLSPEEINEIQNLLLMSFASVLKQYGHHPEKAALIIKQEKKTKLNIFKTFNY